MYCLMLLKHYVCFLTCKLKGHDYTTVFFPHSIFKEEFTIMYCRRCGYNPDLLSDDFLD